MVNSVAGGGTLLSFPALLWIGVAPITANATNTVALWPGSLAGMVGFRNELGDTRRWMLILGAPSVIGAALGAALLLRTPAETFALLVPYLILLATVLFAAQEPLRRALRISTRQDDSPRRAWWVGAMFFQFCVAVYGGYFGAGIGILMLAALGLLGLTDIHQMNALKNFLALCINGCAAAYFVWAGAVSWRHALVMTVGAIAGGFGGARLAKRLGRTFVRRAVVAVGLAMAISLFYRH